MNAHPALARRAFQQFLDRFPERPERPEVVEQLRLLQPVLDELRSRFGLSGEGVWDLLERQERVQALTKRGRLDEARRAAEELLRRYPDFVPALNNLSLVQAAGGAVEQAIATAHR